MGKRVLLLTAVGLILATAPAVPAESPDDAFFLDGDRWRAVNTRHGFLALIADDGLRVEPVDSETQRWSVDLKLLRYGRPGLLVPVFRGVTSSPSKQRVEITREGLIEWYVNDEKGLEQGFDLDARPAGPAHAELVLELGMTTELMPVFSSDGQAVEFFSGNRLALRYAKLVVLDAVGRRLPARMEPFSAAGERGIRLVVDDRDAQYPIVVDPAMNTASWSAFGPNDGSAFGNSVASAGDVNGDGYGDVIIGSPNGENGQANEGMAFVFLGSPSGLAATPVWSDEGDQVNGLYGYSVGTAGDVNGDGYADVLVGCGFCAGGGTWRGEAYVYFGSPTGPSSVPDQVFTGQNDNDLFGLAVSTAGDFNGDGYSDIVVGAPGANGSRGRAVLYGGSPGGLSQNLPVFEGQSPAESFGQAVAGGGDVDGDGFGDVAVAAPNQGATSNDGRVWLFRGSPAGVSAVHSRSNPSGATGARFGAALAFVGDTMGDGTTDIAIGAPNEADVDPPNATKGRVYVFHNLLNDYWSTFAADPAGTAFGTSVAGAGDVNDDGRAEILVGDDNFLSNRGRAYVFKHPAAGVPSNGKIWNPWDVFEPGDLAGTGVAAADVNGDGRPDMIVGAIGSDENAGDDRGEVRVYHSANPRWEIVQVAQTIIGGSGYQDTEVTAIGDVNGDGYEDLAVAEPDTQKVSVFHGQPTGFNAPLDWWDSGPIGSWFGDSVAAAGDVNGDGYGDLLIGAPEYNGGSIDEGQAYLYFGSATGLSATPDWTLNGTQSNSFLGQAVAGLGDVNGDGFADVAVSAPSWTAGESLEGRVFVFHGSAAGLAATADTIHEADQPLAFLGASLDGAGDVNGDGYSDMIAGAEGYGINGAGLLYLGGPAGLSSAPVWQGDLGLPVLSGFEVAGAGDVNGDGYADVAIASKGYSNPELNEGAAALFHGGPLGPSLVPDWFRETDFAGQEWGACLRGGGDLTGDGFSDLLIGSGGGGDFNVYWGSSVGLTTANRYMTYAQGRTTIDAADFNGDGFADVVSSGDDGFGYFPFENLALAPDRRVRTRRADDSAPIAPLGASNSDNSFGFRVTPPIWAGYGQVAVEVEVKPLGVAFDETGTIMLPDRPSFGPPPALEIINSLAPGTLYHWRTRHHFDIHLNPFFAYGPWSPSPNNAWSEPDFRTGGNAAAGAVPDGNEVPGAQMTVAMVDDGQGGEAIMLDWGDACGGETTDYAIYIGTIGDFTSHVPCTCSTGGLTQFGYPPDPFTPQYYLVVPINEAGQREGGYGFASDGIARSASQTPCYPAGEPATCDN